jgi:hypothetical protein
LFFEVVVGDKVHDFRLSKLGLKCNRRRISDAANPA